MSLFWIPQLRRILFILGMFIVTGHTAAVTLQPFESWSKLSKESPDIIIARCISINEQSLVIDGVRQSVIEVTQRIKGESPLGLTTLFSQLDSCRNGPTLIFSTYRRDADNASHTAIESYRLVPLAADFDVGALAGKSLQEKIDYALNHKQ